MISGCEYLGVVLNELLNGEKMREALMTEEPCMG